MGFATDAIHAGQAPDPTTGAISPPIYQTSTYVQEGLGRHKGYEYARTQNPTREMLERKVAALEGGRHAIAFASGMAAIHALLGLFGRDDHIVVTRHLYGGTFRLLEQVLKESGPQVTWVDARNPENVARSLREQTRLVYLETPANPLLHLADIRAVSQICCPRGIWVSVDNTFLTPCLQRPLQLGAGVVIHSTTKFLNGHSDSVGGVVVVNDTDLARRLRFVQNAAGAILSPFDSWLVLRGIKTLAVRMPAHDQNGRALAAFLQDHPGVGRVYYPGLPSHPQHELACRQQLGFGSLIAFDVGTGKNAERVLGRVRLCSLAESLGGVETLISHPATMSHASLPADTRKELGITPGLLRLSVGLEDVQDLMADLDWALARL